MLTYTSYQNSIEIGSILKSSLNDILNNKYANSKIVIICDENTHDNCLEFMLTSFESLKEAEVMLLPAGEENKVLEVCFQVWEALTEYNIGRKDLIINLGGGVVTDMGGFIASIFKRGIDFIHIPTSLLAMVDASIGGKTGIDLGPYKNQLGVFSPAKHIFIDPVFLSTLPDEEWLNGYAEMLKHALISDRDHFEYLKKNNSKQKLGTLKSLSKSIEVKVDIINDDPLEQGRRKLLNFGHTIGHAIEGYYLDKEPISHGHAVAIGMIAESYISLLQKKISQEDYSDIETTILKKFKSIDFSASALKEIIHLTKNDKKNVGDTINCVLIDKIGECEIDCPISEQEIEEALVYIQKLAK